MLAFHGRFANAVKGHRLDAYAFAGHYAEDLVQLPVVHSIRVTAQGQPLTDVLRFFAGRSVVEFDGLYRSLTSGEDVLKTAPGDGWSGFRRIGVFEGHFYGVAVPPGAFQDLAPSFAHLNWK